ncbi:MAG TPA: hypothetical protein DE036_07380 [Actinobacteria bacterium]|nr:hypothetical protein [Actinomycetota bacterium]
MQKGLQSSFEIWCWDRDEIEESGHVGVKLKDTIYGFYPRKGEVVGGVFHPVDALGVVLVESETDCADRYSDLYLEEIGIIVALKGIIVVDKETNIIRSETIPIPSVHVFKIRVAKEVAEILETYMKSLQENVANGALLYNLSKNNCVTTTLECLQQANVLDVDNLKRTIRAPSPSSLIRDLSTIKELKTGELSGCRVLTLGVAGNHFGWIYDPMKN